MLLQGRSATPANYKFGFQGQIKDDDITEVDGGHLAFTYRIHDARSGRFLSVDPLFRKYPWNSSYAFSENRVIDGIDLEGLEFRRSQGIFSARGTSFITKIKKPSSHLIITINTQALPNYYKRLKIQDESELSKAIENTQFKLNQISPPDALPKSPRDADESPVGKGVDWLVDNTAEVEALEEVKLQARDFISSKQLVDNAKELGLIPAQFENNASFYADLTNFIFDGSLASGTGKKLQAYNQIISYLGYEIFSNKESVMGGVYKRIPESIEIVPNNWGLDMPGTRAVPIEHFGNDKLQELVEIFNNTPDGCINCNTIQKKSP